MKTALIVILALLVIGGGVYMYRTSDQDIDTDRSGTACTMDAKLCPDGSYVGRVGPNCEFAACPGSPVLNSTTTIINNVTNSTSTTALPRALTVTYTSSGFSPKTAVIADGGTVTFVNRSGENMRVASDPHPTHGDYPGFDEGSTVGNGGSWSFTFNREGSWGYHNHVAPSHDGTIIVQ